MNHRRLHIIAYDISDDNRRTRLAKFLLDYGDRVQHSVFEGDLEPEDVRRILREGAKHVREGDSLRIYPLCAECATQIQSLGREGPLDTADLIIV